MIGAYLNEQISLQRPAKIEDEGAGKRVVWQEAGNVWAKVVPISSRERFFAGQSIAEITHRVYVRFRTDVKNDMRIKRGDDFYLIDSIVDVDGGRLFLELLCTEVQENE
jgi:SPP1 family predicted phage head-tail adaptor